MARSGQAGRYSKEDSGGTNVAGVGDHACSLEGYDRAVRTFIYVFIHCGSDPLWFYSCVPCSPASSPPFPHNVEAAGYGLGSPVRFEIIFGHSSNAFPVSAANAHKPTPSYRKSSVSFWRPDWACKTVHCGLGMQRLTPKHKIDSSERLEPQGCVCANYASYGEPRDGSITTSSAHCSDNQVYPLPPRPDLSY